jgi:phosphoglycolate phosphatase-like HAD superfamily hydrolase
MSTDHPLGLAGHVRACLFDLDGVLTETAKVAEGSPDDPPDARTINGLGNAKNELVLAKIKHDGVEAYAGSVGYVKAVRATACWART